MLTEGSLTKTCYLKFYSAESFFDMRKPFYAFCNWKVWNISKVAFSFLSGTRCYWLPLQLKNRTNITLFNASKNYHDNENSNIQWSNDKCYWRNRSLIKNISGTEFWRLENTSLEKTERYSKNSKPYPSTYSWFQNTVIRDSPLLQISIFILEKDSLT